MNLIRESGIIYVVAVTFKYFLDTQTSLDDAYSMTESASDLEVCMDEY
jgi:hypothetical protein